MPSPGAEPESLEAVHDGKPVEPVAGGSVLQKLKKIKKRFSQELKFYRALFNDRRTPRLSKWLLGAAIAYAVSPIDLIPDFIPVIGHLDDAVIVPLLVYFALKTIPDSLIRKHRRKIGLR